MPVLKRHLPLLVIKKKSSSEWLNLLTSSPKAAMCSTDRCTAWTGMFKCRFHIIWICWKSSLSQRQLEHSASLVTRPICRGSCTKLFSVPSGVGPVEDLLITLQTFTCQGTEGGAHSPGHPVRRLPGQPRHGRQLRLGPGPSKLTLLHQVQVLSEGVQ